LLAFYIFFYWFFDVDLSFCTLDGLDISFFYDFYLDFYIFYIDDLFCFFSLLVSLFYLDLVV